MLSPTSCFPIRTPPVSRRTASGPGRLRSPRRPSPQLIELEVEAASSSTLTRQFLAAAEPSRSAAPVQPAGRAFFDFLTCVRAGQEAGAGWPGDPAGRFAIAAHALDRDDLHHASLTHPG